MLWNIWLPPSTAGTTVEIPVRAPGSPANMWIHVAANTTNWGGFPQGDVNSDWKRIGVQVDVGVEPGDIPVASLCCVGLAGIRREEQRIFDTDDWGVALDSVAPVGPAALTFIADFATAGKSWIGGISLLADILVLRPSLIPPVPTPYGTYPEHSHHLSFKLDQYLQLVRKIKYLTKDQVKLLRVLTTELQELLTSYESEKTEVTQRPTTKTARISVRVLPSQTPTGDEMRVHREKPHEQMSQHKTAVRRGRSSRKESHKPKSRQR